jgi:selenocysteine-specific elongation factor
MKSVVVGTAGHIDHGKSALVRALTGTDPDRLKEEKERGITIDLGFAHLTEGDLNLAVVDVPGHERFVRNMLAGAGGIDLVLLVVAADESVMPQTREHFEICRLLGVERGIIALTKSDLADADMLAVAESETRELVADSALKSAPIVPVSSKTEQGLVALRAALAASAAAVKGRRDGGAARLPIDRVFSMKGFGTVVTGTLVSGRVAVGAEYVIEPGGRRVTIRGLQVHGASREAARAGERTAANIGGLSVEEIERGQVLTSPGAFEPTRTIDAVLELVPGAKALKYGARVRFHQGTAEVLGRVALVGPPGETIDWRRAFVRIRLEKPAVLTRGDRYILRTYSPAATIAGGRVLDSKPPPRSVRSKGALDRADRLSDLSAAGTTAALGVMIEESGGSGLPVAEFVSRAAVDPGAVDESVAASIAEGLAVRVGDRLVAPAVLERLKAAIVKLVTAHHREQRLSEGVPREEVRRRTLGRGHPAVFERAVADLATSGKISGRDRLTLASHRLELTADETRARDIIDEALRSAGLSPPDVAQLATLAGVPATVIERVIGLLVRQRRLAKLDGFVFHEEALGVLRQQVAAMKKERQDATLDVGVFKERFAVTRKFAIPLLEYLDRERVTRRVGAARVIL